VKESLASYPDKYGKSTPGKRTSELVTDAAREYTASFPAEITYYTNGEQTYQYCHETLNVKEVHPFRKKHPKLYVT
jgi:hypothetical protein